MTTVINIKCEKCGKTYFSQSPDKILTSEELLELFKFQVAEQGQMTCQPCSQDNIEIEPIL